jgi:hypothetical protein
MWARLSKRRRKAFIITGAALVSVVILFLVFVNSFLEPMVRSRLHTLIIKGSDSLYTYTLGDLQTSFIKSAVVLKNLRLRIDSNRFRQLNADGALPAITVELNLIKGSMEGIGFFPLLLKKRLSFSNIRMQDASITIYRHRLPGSRPEKVPPLWKTIRPAVKSIGVRTVRLGNLRLAYRDADTAQLVRLRLESCFARLDDFRVDSASFADTSRVFYMKDISVDIGRMDFFSADSLYHLQAGNLTYNSVTEVLQVSDVSLRPTLDTAAFYRRVGYRVNRNSISFQRMKMTGFRLYRLWNEGKAVADELLVDGPRLDIYLDKTFPPHPDSRIGRSPQIWIRNVGYGITVNRAAFRNASLVYTEKNEKTGHEGQIRVDDLDLRFSNITNDSLRIRKLPQCIVEANGNIPGGIPLKAKFIFHPGDPAGRFEGSGTIGAVNAAQLNPVSEPLAGMQIRSFDMQYLQFSLSGDPLTAISNVSMPYKNLQIVFLKTDKETGSVSPKKGITKLLNRYIIYDANPEPGAAERKASGIKKTRTSTQSFAALIWQSIFAGMQDLMFRKD